MHSLSLLLYFSPSSSLFLVSLSDGTIVTDSSIVASDPGPYVNLSCPDYPYNYFSTYSCTYRIDESGGGCGSYGGRAIITCLIGSMYMVYIRYNNVIRIKPMTESHISKNAFCYSSKLCRQILFKNCAWCCLFYL